MQTSSLWCCRAGEQAQPRIRRWGRRGSLRRGTGAGEAVEAAEGVDASAGGAGYPGGQEKGCKAQSLSAPVRIWICALLKDATCELMRIRFRVTWITFESSIFLKSRDQMYCLCQSNIHQGWNDGK